MSCHLNPSWRETSAVEHSLASPQGFNPQEEEVTRLVHSRPSNLQLEHLNDSGRLVLSLQPKE